MGCLLWVQNYCKFKIWFYFVNLSSCYYRPVYSETWLCTHVCALINFMLSFWQIFTFSSSLTFFLRLYFFFLYTRWIVWKSSIYHCHVEWGYSVIRFTHYSYMGVDFWVMIYFGILALLEWCIRCKFCHTYQIWLWMMNMILDFCTEFFQMSAHDNADGRFISYFK